MNEEQTFNYTIDRVRTRFSKHEIVESLKEYAKVHGKTPGMRDYNSWDGRLLSAERIRVTFGGWGKALHAAGLRAQRSCKFDLREMVEAFKSCWRKHGSVPSKRQLETYLEQNNCPFRWISYMNVWGGLQALARRVVDFEKGHIPESALYQRRSQATIRRPISLKDRDAVLKRDNYRCVNCGASPKIDKSVQLEVDHILPVVKGGTNVLENLQTLCFECNQGKKDREE